jgi:predicted GH43/DUF377 family glycosyl hydrolase
MVFLILMNVQTKLLVKPGEIRPTINAFKVRGVFNPAAIRLPDQKILLFGRVAETPFHDERAFIAPRFSGKKNLKIHLDSISRAKMEFKGSTFLLNNQISRLPTISHLRKILLDKHGENVLNISQKPDFYGLSNDGDFGVEDPRITFFKREKFFAMTYVSVSEGSSVCTSLATSTNLKAWERKGIIFRQQNKDVVIFPEKFNGYYVALNRPEGVMVFDKPSIWISYSKDLLFWGKDRPLVAPRQSCWDDLRIGSGSVPIKTAEGWLSIYHGVTTKTSNPKSRKIYSAGALLFSHKDPAKVIGRTPTSEPLLKPTYDFENEGFNGGVIFPTAVIPSLDGESLLIYCGVADTNIVLKKIKVKDILNSLE